MNSKKWSRLLARISMSILTALDHRRGVITNPKKMKQLYAGTVRFCPIAADSWKSSSCALKFLQLTRIKTNWPNYTFGEQSGPPDRMIAPISATFRNGFGNGNVFRIDNNQLHSLLRSCWQSAFLWIGASGKNSAISFR